MTKVKPWAN